MKALSLKNLNRQSVYMVGIKGSGMCGLAELVKNQGAEVSGSDVAETFYTDKVLAGLGITVKTGFSASHLPEKIDYLIYSAAYEARQNPELRAAAETGTPMLSYPQALGCLSMDGFSVGVAGAHGKTTTTALIGALVKALNLTGAVLAGSAVTDFGGGGAFCLGGDFLVAETCEYRRHFLHFHPNLAVITNVEAEHLDYFTDEKDMRRACVAFAERLPRQGELLYCSDDRGAKAVAEQVARRRSDLIFTPYGRQADSAFALTSRGRGRRTSFRVKAIEETLTLNLPGDHNLLNANAAIAVATRLLKRQGLDLTKKNQKQIQNALASFQGSRRRSEIIGLTKGILFIDDYAHHPTAIVATLNGLAEHYPDKRLVVDFMSHTYSRTEAFFEDFAAAFAKADVVILHDIYASAREIRGRVTGRRLFEAVAEHHKNAHFFAQPLQAFDFCRRLLKKGDLFLTMGAGDNWRLGHTLRQWFAGKDNP